MTGVPDDFEMLASRNPATHPQQLADIAARRRDLHATILANPQAYPALRQWIGQVNPQPSPPTPAMPYPAAAAHVPPPGLPRPRRRGLGWVLGGCGCLTLVGGFVVVAMLIGGLSATSGDRDQPHQANPPSAGAGTIEAHVAVIEAESAAYRRLATRLDGNPVAALVTRPARFERLQTAAAKGPINAIHAARLADDAKTYRADLERAIAAAAGRRANASGTIAEKLVDRAGNGFIDIRWDADVKCGGSSKPGSSKPGSRTAGCVSENPVAVHVLPPKAQRGGDRGIRLVVLHELTHLYMRAEDDAAGDAKSRSLMLIEQGLFQGSSEKFADCYALTYLNASSLQSKGFSFGYGYVCNAAERREIRDWASRIDAPMPR